MAEEEHAIHDEALDEEFNDDEEEETPQQQQEQRQQLAMEAEAGPSSAKPRRAEQRGGEGDYANEEALRMKQLLDRMSDEQLERYEYFRRSTLHTVPFRRAMEALAGIPKESSNEEVRSIAIAGRAAGKMFVGDLVEAAVDVQQRRNESGPLKPWHIREAFRVLSRDGRYPASLTSSSRFFRLC